MNVLLRRIFPLAVKRSLSLETNERLSLSLFASDGDFSLPGSRSTKPSHSSLQISSVIILLALFFSTESFPISQAPSGSKLRKLMAGQAGTGETVAAGWQCLAPWTGCSGRFEEGVAPEWLLVSSVGAPIGRLRRVPGEDARVLRDGR